MHLVLHHLRFAIFKATKKRKKKNVAKGENRKMAIHNEIRIVGFVTDVRSREDQREFTLTVMTIRHGIAGLNRNRHTLIYVKYPYDDMNDRMASQLALVRVNDIVDIEGVLMNYSYVAETECPRCRSRITVLTSQLSVVYPRSLYFKHQTDAALDEMTRDERESRLFEILRSRYEEVSNRVILIGTVVSDPVPFSYGPPDNRQTGVHYVIGVNRKYRIPTQGVIEDDDEDYFIIENYGDKATEDALRLKGPVHKEDGTLESQGSMVFVDGYAMMKKVRKKITDKVLTCQNCMEVITECDLAIPISRIAAFSVEYLSRYRTDDEIIAENEVSEED